MRKEHKRVKESGRGQMLSVTPAAKWVSQALLSLLKPHLCSLSFSFILSPHYFSFIIILAWVFTITSVMCFHISAFACTYLKWCRSKFWSVRRNTLSRQLFYFSMNFRFILWLHGISKYRKCTYCGMHIAMVCDNCMILILQKITEKSRF